MGTCFASQTDSKNRVQDAIEVLQETGLQEKGRDDITIFLNDGKQTTVSSGYRRIVYGDHGPYIELEKDKISWNNFPVTNKKSKFAYYDERYTKDGKFMSYVQRRSVQNVPNPPKTPGKPRVRNNRSEGYADYLPGMCYLPALSVSWKDTGDPDSSARITKIFHPHSHLNPAPLSKSGNRKTKLLPIGRGQKLRLKVKLLADGIINCSTWTAQSEHVVNVTKGKIFPGVPAEDWEIPVTKQFIVTQGPRPVAFGRQEINVLMQQ